MFSINVDTQEEKDQLIAASKRLHDEVAPLDECPMSCNDDPGFNTMCHIYTNPDLIVVGSVEEDGGAMASLGSTPGMGAPVLASPGVTGSGDVTEPAPGVEDEEEKKKKKRTKLMLFSEFLNGAR